MNYKHIEQLVTKAKLGDNNAKEELVMEFTPFIDSLSRKTFIYSYDTDDIKNECFRILFNCVSLYNSNSHRFVAYAINGIKKSINDLIKKNLNRSAFEGLPALISNEDQIKHIVYSRDVNIEDLLCNKEGYEKINSALDNLNIQEKLLVDFVFLKGNTLTNYAYRNNISYVAANRRKRNTLKKLRNQILLGGDTLCPLMN